LPPGLPPRIANTDEPPSTRSLDSAEFDALNTRMAGARAGHDDVQAM